MRRWILAAALPLAAACGDAEPSDGLDRTLELQGAPLPEATLGFPYRATLQIVGADPAALEWAVLNDLPPVFSLTPGPDGAATLAGVPREAGRFELRLLVTAGDGRALERTLTLTVADAESLAVVTEALPPARVGEAYTASVAARGGTGAGYRWSLPEGGLPAGLALVDPAAETLVVAGTPEAEARAVLLVQVEDSAGSRARRALDLVIEPAPEVLAIEGPEPPGGLVDVELDLVFTARRGQAPMTWSTSDAVPGLTFAAGASREARLTGIPTRPGRYPFTARVVDVEGQVAIETVEIIVAEPLTARADEVRVGTRGASYSTPLVANEAGGDHRWVVAEGRLPPGLSLVEDGARATIEGRAADAGTFTSTVEVSDRLNQRATVALEIVVAEPLTLGPAVAPAATLGAAYRAPYTALGGRPPYAFSVAQGSLPPGITLSGGPDESAALSGVAGRVGSFGVGIEVVDRDARRARVDVTIRIAPSGAPLTIRPPNLTAGFETCAGGHVTLETTGGARFGQTWTVQGSLPPGLRVAPTGTPTSALGGVPTAPGLYPVTVRVDDSNGESATRSFTLDVATGTTARWATVQTAAANGDPQLALLDLCAPTPSVDRTWASSTSLFEVAHSDDGRWLALARSVTSTTAELRIVDLAAQPPAERVVPSTGVVDPPRFTPDGGALFYTEIRLEDAALGTALMRLDPAQGAPVELAESAAGTIWGVERISPDGQWVFFGPSRDELLVVAAAGGASFALPEDAAITDFDAAGRFVFLEQEISNDDTPVFFRLGSTMAPSPVSGALPFDQDFVLTPDRQAGLLIWDVNPPQPWVRFTIDAAGPVAQGPVPGTEPCDRAYTFRDGRWVICSGPSDIVLWDSTGALGLVTVGPLRGFTAVSDDGRHVVAETIHPPSGAEVVAAYDLDELPNAAPRPLSPPPLPWRRWYLDDPASRHVFIEGPASGGPTTTSQVYDVTRRPDPRRVWAGPASMNYVTRAWRADGSGLFVDGETAIRWLDLSVPGDVRVTTVPGLAPPPAPGRPRAWAQR